MTHSDPAREAVAAGRRRNISSPERSFWETPRQIAHVEADEAATRLINSHFKNDAERARVSIPANPERDDDLIIRSYIRQQARLSASPAPAAGGLEAVREIEAIFRRHSQANDYAKGLIKRIAFDVVPAVRKALSAALAPSTSAATRRDAGFKAGIDAAAEYLLACDDYGDRHKAGEIRKIAPPTPAVESAQVKVKPLVWSAIERARSDEDPTTEETGDHEAMSPFGEYFIEAGFGSDSYVWSVSFCGDFVIAADDPDTAKAAAQADYEARIRASLATDAEG